MDLSTNYGLGNDAARDARNNQILLDRMVMKSSAESARIAAVQMRQAATQARISSDAAIDRARLKNANQHVTDMAADTLKTMKDYRDQMRSAM